MTRIYENRSGVQVSTEAVTTSSGSGDEGRIPQLDSSGLLDASFFPSSGVSITWGSITGTLSSQTDLLSALNAKQAALSGTGFVKITGTTVSYDNSTYLTTTSAASAYQPLDADLTTISGLTATTDNFLVSVSSAWASRTPAQVRTTLGLVIGTNVQAWDADLDALAALSGTNTIYYRSAANTWTAVTIGGNLTFLAGTLNGNAGTVTTVSVASANGITGSVATATTTPVITLTLGAITPSSVVSSGNVTIDGTLIGRSGGSARFIQSYSVGVVTNDADTQYFRDSTGASNRLVLSSTGAAVTGVMAATGAVTGSNLSGTNTGDQTITLTGNVTGSGTGSFATTIAAGVVTLAMQANMATASVVYRKTAGSGAPEVNTLATLKTDLGLTGTNSGDQTITLTGNVTGSGTGSFATTIAAGVVTLAMQANMATASVVYRKTAGSGAPEVQTLATLKTDLGLTGTNSGDQTITLTGNVTGSGTGSFATTIAAGVVTLAMQANMATASVIYRKTAGSGAPEVQTLATLKTDLGLTGTNSGDQTTVSGNAGTATALATARNFSLSGGGITSATVSFDGTGAVVLVPVVAAITPTTVAATSIITSAQVIRAQGSTSPASGAGVEIVYDSPGNLGYVLAYDRTGAAYKNLNITGLTVNIQSSATTIGAFSSTGLAVTGSVAATTYLKSTAKAVAALTAAATAGAGARDCVTDALAPTFGATVVGGGAITTPVYSDGTNWKVG